MTDLVLALLRDSAWNGVAALMALITVVFLLLDRYSATVSHAFTRLVPALTATVNHAGFVLYGTPLALLFMAFGGLVANFVNFFAQGTGSVPGRLGTLLLTLSQAQFLFWGFNPNLTVLELQFGTAGLWGGAFAGALTFACLRIFQRVTLRGLPRFYHIAVLSTGVAVVLVGLRNGLRPLLSP